MSAQGFRYHGVLNLDGKRRALAAMRRLTQAMVEASPPASESLNLWSETTEAVRQIDEDLLRLDAMLRFEQKRAQAASGATGRLGQLEGAEG